uniref:RNA/RNP complex-1-interacting phosphatase-like n=1 Tax=Pristiophorus japonicus TaxID=55135 RepID=UPI00398EF37E
MALARRGGLGLGLGLLQAAGSGRRFWDPSEGRAGGGVLSAAMSKNKSKIPDRWQEYSAVGRRLSGTRFIAFKVPLKKLFESSLPATEVFSPTDLVRQIEDQREELGKIIDLTFTERYYDSMELPEGLHYAKIFTAGHEVPNADNILTFKQAVKTFLAENTGNDKLVGVHCTHGVNRTGYLICRYLIDVDGMEPRAAIDLFNKSRGYPIERQNYIQDLLNGPRRSNKGIDVPALCSKPKRPCHQQPVFTQRDRSHQRKYPTSNGFREYSQSVCPPRQSAYPNLSAQHPRGQKFGNGAMHQTVPYHGQTEAHSNYDCGRRQESPQQSYRPKSLQQSYQPESSWRSYRPESPCQSYQPESSWRSYQPKSSWQSYQPESTQRSCQPESSWRSCQSKAPQRSCQPESSWRSCQPEAPQRSYQQPPGGWNSRGQKQNSRGQGRSNTHQRWDD